MTRAVHKPSRRRPGGASGVLIVSGSVGAGHDGAAHELARRLRSAGIHVEVRDYLDAIPSAGRHMLREGYTVSVGYIPAFFEWLFQSIERRGVVHAGMRAFSRLGERRLLGWAAERPYALVLSTYPFASQALGRLRAAGSLASPVVTYLTDPAVHRSWVHHGVDAHWTVTEATAQHGTEVIGTP